MVCPSVDVGTVALQLRAVEHVDVKTGAKNDCIKVLGAAIRQGDTHAVLHGLYIFPATSQLQAERGKRIAAAHGFPWWRYLFVKNIRIKTPFALIVQLRIATQEARERCCFALVDLRHQLASRKLPHGGACFQCASRIVKGRGTGTQHRNGFALHGCKVNLIHGVKDAALGQWVLHGQIGEVGPARCTAAIAAQRQNDFAGAYGLAAVGARNLGHRYVVFIGQTVQAGEVLDRNVCRITHPQQVVTPIYTANLVQRCPTGRAGVEIRDVAAAVLGFIPSSKGQTGHAQIGADELFGAAQRQHAGIGCPWSFATTWRRIDDANVAQTLALQGKCSGLAAHASPDNEDIQHAVCTGCDDPIGGRVVQPLQVTPRF